MANFYGSIEGADLYHAQRGNSAWPLIPLEKRQSLLIVASGYVDALGTQPPSLNTMRAFPGVKSGGRAQALQWPRKNAYDNDGFAINPATVPVEVEHATYEAALKEFQVKGGLTPDFDPATAVKRAKVGPLETEFFGANTSADLPNKPVIGLVNDILAPVMVLRSRYPVAFVV